MLTPFGDQTVRDVVDGKWAIPDGDADEEFGHGMFALPGLTDGHAHFAAPIGKDWKTDTIDDAKGRVDQALRAGVLLALDKGWSNLDTIEIIKTVPPEHRPEIEAAGIINAVSGGYWPDFARELDVTGFEAGIDQSIAEGGGWVKLVGDWPRRGQGPVANFTEAELSRVVEMAGADGQRVAIHTMGREVPSMAVQAGIHSIEHGLFLSEEDLDALGSRGGMWVPTVLRMEAVVNQLGAGSSGGKLLLEGLENVARLLPLAAEAGVRLLAGTDVTIGAHEVALEAQRLAELGLPGEMALNSVSTSAYEATGRPFSFELGSTADVVMFSENPLEDLGVLSHPVVVMRMGARVR